MRPKPSSWPALLEVRALRHDPRADNPVVTRVRRHHVRSHPIRSRQETGATVCRTLGISCERPIRSTLVLSAVPTQHHRRSVMIELVVRDRPRQSIPECPPKMNAAWPSSTTRSQRTAGARISFTDRRMRFWPDGLVSHTEWHPSQRGCRAHAEAPFLCSTRCAAAKRLSMGGPRLRNSST